MSEIVKWVHMVGVRNWQGRKFILFSTKPANLGYEMVTIYESRKHIGMERVLMEDLTTELGFHDFLASRRNEVENAMLRKTRDYFLAQDAVAEAMVAVCKEYESGELRLVTSEIIAFWKKRSFWKLLRMHEQHNRAIYGTPYAKKRVPPEEDECSELYRQPRSRRSQQGVSEPLSESTEYVLLQKENGQAAAKQLSALNLFASNNEEYLAVLTALTESIRANERVSDDGTIKINWSELARQSNFILNQKRFDDRSVKTCFNKFSRHASAYLRESVA